MPASRDLHAPVMVCVSLQRLREMVAGQLNTTVGNEAWGPPPHPPRAGWPRRAWGAPPIYYGLSGCRAYDESGSACSPECKKREGALVPWYCGATWCYVDPETCKRDEAQCREIGALPGSDAPSEVALCRTRSHKMSTCTGGGAYFSYETCDTIDFFSENEAVVNRTFKAVMLPEYIWLKTEKEKPKYGGRSVGGYYGVMAEFWLDVIGNEASGLAGIHTNALPASKI